MADSVNAVASNLAAPEKERDQAIDEREKQACAQADDLPVTVHTGNGKFFEHKSASEARREVLMSHEEMERRYHEFISDPLTSLDNCPADKPPVGATIAFNNVFGDLVTEGKVALKLHPLYKRWTVFAKGRTKEGAIGWYPALVICHTPEYGKLPDDLQYNLPEELRAQFTGRMGDYKEPDTLDFLHMREFADRYRWRGRSGSKQAQDLQQKQIDQYIAKRKVRHDQTLDFVEHNRHLYERDVNRKYGSMQGLAFVPGTSLEQFDKENPRFLDIPVTSEATGEVIFYRRHRIKDIERKNEEVMKEYVAFEKELKEARDSLDKFAVNKVKAKYFGDPLLVKRFELAEADAGREVPKAEPAAGAQRQSPPTPLAAQPEGM